MDATAEHGLTVLLSSHILSDLERVCDYLILLSASREQLAGDIEELVRSHKRLVGPRTSPAAVASLHDVIEESHTDRQTMLLVRVNGHVFDPRWEVQEVSLEDIVLAYMGSSHVGPSHSEHSGPRQGVERQRLEAQSALGSGREGGSR
jgi:ABC-2 type transport system ATP-binding protein